MNEMTKFLVLILLIGFLPGYSSVNVNQSEGLVIVQSGKQAVLNCNQDDSSYYYMYWYQHKAGQGLKLMVLSTDAGSEEMEGDFKDKWYVKRPTLLVSSLHLKESMKEDSATYFCASSMGGGAERQYFGSGTILSVLEKDEQQREPKVKIFPPNKQEFKEHNVISLVCVASGFFPEHVRLTWFENGKPREDLYQNVPIKMNDGNFSTSKRLTLTQSEYFNPDSTFKCTAGFVGSENIVSDEINGELDCGISKESYTMYTNQGKISYIMVLFKSGLYALIVLAIIWRRKVLSGSC